MWVYSRKYLFMNPIGAAIISGIRGREGPASRATAMTREGSTSPPRGDETLPERPRTQEALARASRMALSCLDSWESWLAVCIVCAEVDSA
jgi:hypothetical protein